MLGIRRFAWTGLLALVCALGAVACNEDNEPADTGSASDAAVDVDADASSHADAARADGGSTDTGGPVEQECKVNAPTSCPEPKVRYADVEPIFKARCTSCHNGMQGQWPLTDYSHVVSWALELRGVMSTCAMPPVGSGIEMPTAEREKILAWLRCNAPM